jgi:hypothetical protein
VSYEEEDTRMVCHMRRIHAVMLGQRACMSYEEEDTRMSYEEEDTCSDVGTKR